MSIRTESYSLEKRTLIAFITDTEFCAAVLPSLDLEYYSNEYARTIIRWVQDYYDTYGRAPNIEMGDIFLRKEQSLKKEVRDIISSILEHLSDLDTEQINTDHSIDIAMEFFRKQELDLTARTMLHHLEDDKLQEAEDILKSYTEINTISGGGVNNFFTDKQLVRDAIEKLWNPGASKDIVFKPYGALGQYMGYLERGWLIGLLAPMKRGKTMGLTELALDAVLQNKNVLFVSAEMPDKDMTARYIKTITGMTASDWDDGDAPTKLIPVFDCMHNQNSSCGLSERPNNTALPKLSEEEDPVDLFYDHADHTPCTHCRKTNKKLYKFTTWFEKVEDLSSKKAMIKKVEAWRPKIDKYLRTRSYPANTTAVSTIEGHVKFLSSRENFDVELLIIDYGDLLIAEKSMSETRHELNNVWVGLKSLAHKLNILVITASQTNRAGMGVEIVESTSTAEDIRKIAIADMFYALDQTKAEKRRGVMRVSPLESRHTNNYSVCYLLQDLARSQFHLDSEIGMFFTGGDSNDVPKKQKNNHTYPKKKSNKKGRIKVTKGV